MIIKVENFMAINAASIPAEPCFVMRGINLKTKAEFEQRTSWQELASIQELVAVQVDDRTSEGFHLEDHLIYWNCEIFFGDS